ncbi:MAG: hypothetical protein AAFX94_04625, partial [Myxococcota bacterium]
MTLRVAIVLMLVACTEETTTAAFGTREEGQSCDETSDCRAGFDCVQDVCTGIGAAGDGGFGAECTEDDQCRDGLLCGRQGPDGEPKERSETRVCTDVVPLPEGSNCGLTVQCDFGLLCSGLGVCVPTGSPNTEAEGEACTEFDSCRRPFVCGPDDRCTRVPVFLGPDCTASNREAGVFRSYFEVPPRDLDAAIEFYRLPYPNDIRVRDGTVDLSGHPSPGDVLGVDVADLYFRPIEADSGGFAVNQPVFFRFSESLDPATLCLEAGGQYSTDGLCSDGGAASVFLVNIDRASDEYNQRRPLELAYDGNAGSFICQNWLGVNPLPGEPLRNGETYAVVLTTAIRDQAGDRPVQDRDFAALLGSAAPEPVELGEAYTAMAPLRAWLVDADLDPTTIANAAVFTTEDATALGPKLRAAARSLPASFAADAVNCDGTAPGPCALPGTDRGCPDAAPVAWFEVQGTYSGPIIQSGTRPYRRTDDGGAIQLDASGDID